MFKKKKAQASSKKPQPKLSKAEAELKKAKAKKIKAEPKKILAKAKKRKPQAVKFSEKALLRDILKEAKVLKISSPRTASASCACSPTGRTSSPSTPVT